MDEQLHPFSVYVLGAHRPRLQLTEGDSRQGGSLRSWKGNQGEICVVAQAVQVHCCPCHHSQPNILPRQPDHLRRDTIDVSTQMLVWVVQDTCQATIGPLTLFSLHPP